MLNELKDNILIFKESVRSQVLHSPLLQDPDTVDRARKISRHLGFKKIDKIIVGKPDTIIVITPEAVIRMPLNGLSAARCRLNNRMVKDLAATGIVSYVPRFLGEGILDGQRYYCEKRIRGAAIDLPINKIDVPTKAAVDFITEFHKMTVRDIVIDDGNFKRLFGRGFGRLLPCLNVEYKAKLLRIQEDAKRSMAGKTFKTVWHHGDYKIENILFDTRRWSIVGVIDWDLSRKNGIPLLDIFYLLAYNEYTLTRRGVMDVFRRRFLSAEFSCHEKAMIARYMDSLGLSDDFIEPMLVMFFLHHVTARFGQELNGIKSQANKGFLADIESVIDTLCGKLVHN